MEKKTYLYGTYVLSEKRNACSHFAFSVIGNDFVDRSLCSSFFFVVFGILLIFDLFYSFLESIVVVFRCLLIVAAGMGNNYSGLLVLNWRLSLCFSGSKRVLCLEASGYSKESDVGVLSFKAKLE